jgi:hypothetical protein
MEQKPKSIGWTAPEFVHYPKSFVWFAVLTIICLGIVVYFLIAKEFLTATLFGLLYAIVFYFSRAKPKDLNIEISGRGLKLNHNLIPYQQLKSFWIIYSPPEVKTLNFETTAYFNRFVTLQLEQENPAAIREFLLQFLPEDLDRGEQFADKLGRTLKF